MWSVDFKALILFRNIIIYRVSFVYNFTESILIIKVHLKLYNRELIYLYLPFD